MKIAVVGGSGFIGTRLIKRLLESGETIRIIDKNPSTVYPFLSVYADVRKVDSLVKCLDGCDTIYNLAAEHRDDVSLKSLYDDVNVGGAQNICIAAEKLNIKKIIFTSSVAVYGFAPPNTDESGSFNPFNDYGRTKMLAEGVFREWLAKDTSRSLVIVRPTVVFGERNRGNVYNLLRQMSGKMFAMIGKGTNVKSMAYVENVAAFLQFASTLGPGEHLFNYVDKPDLSMNELVSHVKKVMGKEEKVGLRIPYLVGYFGGLCFDLLAKILHKKLPISSIRVKKFNATTQFAARAIEKTSFKAPVRLIDAIDRTVRFEFLNEKESGDTTVYITE